ncbi:hypothetical protein, partial [Lachnotalea glycerini]|uniref:hypothetical protein n=1 Tax=Lachnotalea glycerini TaxID=1763509 RepID=UPI001A9A6BB0
ITWTIIGLFLILCRIAYLFDVSVCIVPDAPDFFDRISLTVYALRGISKNIIGITSFFMLPFL